MPVKIGRTIAYVVAVLAVFVSLSGCAKKEDRSTKEPATRSEPNSQSPAEKPVAKGDKEGLQRQIGEVRAAFLSLQQVCKAKNVDGYVNFWDDETKMAIDGRSLTLDERREGRRKSLAEKPGTLEEIAGAKIESITVDTSQAQKLESLSGAKIKGTMMLVRTDGAAFLFHETAQGWKLFTKASPGYFR
jgi:hypothetical protein